jgi:hypothetical protein
VTLAEPVLWKLCHDDVVMPHVHHASGGQRGRSPW